MVRQAFSLRFFPSRTPRAMPGATVDCAFGARNDRGTHDAITTDDAITTRNAITAQRPTASSTVASDNARARATPEESMPTQFPQAEGLLQRSLGQRPTGAPT